MADILKQSLTAGKVRVTPGMEEGEGFSPLPLRNLSVGKKVSFDVYLKIKEKGKTKPQLLKCCSRGEVFQQEWHQKLVFLKIPSFYFADADVGRVLHYLHHNLEAALADPAPDELEKGALVSDIIQVWTINFFNNPKARTAATVKQSLHFLDLLAAAVQGNFRQLLHLLKNESQRNLRLYTHCLNVSLLGLAFTNYLGWSQEKCRAFGLGALVHDIGLTRIPRAIIEKKGRLSEDEMFEIKRHPFESYRLVKGFVCLPMEALEMVLQHHEHGDGSGYPMGLKTPTIHSWALILRILDSYEALTAKRPWRAALTPHKALEIMRHEWQKSKIYDQNYLKRFIKFLVDQK